MADPSLRQLTQELVDYLFLLLRTFLRLVKLIVVDDTCDDLLLLNVEVILSLLKCSSQLLSMLERSPLQSLSFFCPFLPGFELLSQLYVSLLYQFHVECP